MGLNVLGNVHPGQLEIPASLGSSATGVLLLFFFPIYMSILLAFCCCCSSCKMLYSLGLRWVTKRGIKCFLRVGVFKHRRRRDGIIVFFQYVRTGNAYMELLGLNLR